MVAGDYNTWCCLKLLNLQVTFTVVQTAPVFSLLYRVESLLFLNLFPVHCYVIGSQIPITSLFGLVSVLFRLTLIASMEKFLTLVKILYSNLKRRHTMDFH
jgi:hypothetical protein